MSFYAYIMASGPYGTLYAGSTDNVWQRATQHKERRFNGFSVRYGVDKLVWFERFDTRHGAFVRERRIKEWKRRWKVELIEAMNPEWRDLYDDLINLLTC